MAVAIPITTASPVNADAAADFVAQANCWSLTEKREIKAATQGGVCGGVDHPDQEVMRFEVDDYWGNIPIAGVSGINQSGEPEYEVAYDWVIDWGDGCIENKVGVSSKGNRINHTYDFDQRRTYEITIKPTLTGAQGWFDAFGGRSYITKILTPFPRLSRSAHAGSFYGSFAGWSIVSNLPSNLFLGIDTSAVIDFTSMFESTFGSSRDYCSGSCYFAEYSVIPTIPEGLFASINTENGENFSAMFKSTFYQFGQSGTLATIPKGLFASIKTEKGVDFSFMFQDTFRNFGFSNISSIPSGLFASIKTENGLDFSFMFQNTFRNFGQNSTLATIPPGLFASIKTKKGEVFSSMFQYTFYAFGWESATIPDGLFGSIDVSKGTNFNSMFEETFMGFGTPAKVVANFHQTLRDNILGVYVDTQTYVYTRTYTDFSVGYYWALIVGSEGATRNPTIARSTNFSSISFRYITSSQSAFQIEDRRDFISFGYLEFLGWYADRALTIPFDISKHWYTFNVKDLIVNLYAKTVSDAPISSSIIDAPSCGILSRDCSLVVERKVKFVDLKKVSKSRKADIDWLASTGVAVGSGCKNGGGAKCKFNPNSEVNRGAMAEFLWKLLSQPAITKPVPKINDIESFKGSNPGRYSAIQWLASEGITVIGSSGKYHPEKKVNRGAMAEFMYKLAGHTGTIKLDDPKLSQGGCSEHCGQAENFKSDKELQKLKKSNMNRYYAILWLADMYITKGTNAAGTQYTPNKVVNRGSMAQFLHRLYNVIDIRQGNSG